MNLIDKSLKQASKKLAKVKRVQIYLGKKKVKNEFIRVSESKFIVTVLYHHKKKKPFAFDTMTMVDRDTGKTIKVRKLDRNYLLRKGDEYSVEWVVNVEATER